MTPDPLAAFIEARLQEDEAAALAAARSFGQDWHAELTGGDVITGRVYGKSRDRYVADAMRGSGSVHIARHDPARVLRDVAAKRALIKRHENAVAAVAAGSVSSFIRGQDDGYAQACLDAIRDATAAWAGHPDYDPSWAPGSS